MFNEKQKVTSVAIYTRVSTEEQAQGGFSLDAQLGKLRDYSRLMEWAIAGEYIDGGFTGRNTKRPQYQQMFQDIGKWDAVLVLKMDRIHRSQKNFIAMMEQLAKQDKEFISMQEKFDTSTAMGRFVMNIMSLIAQLESEQIGERITTALIQKAKSDTAGYMNHRVPYGYRWDLDKHKHIEVPGELANVRKIFQYYHDGFNLRQISEKTKLSKSSIRYYLHNSFYAGMERWCNFFRKSELQPVITIEMFNDVQKMLSDRCHSHPDNEPMIIKDQSFKLDREKEKKIPVIQRAKHNWQRAW